MNTEDNGMCIVERSKFLQEYSDHPSQRNLLSKDDDKELENGRGDNWELDGWHDEPSVSESARIASARLSKRAVPHSFETATKPRSNSARSHSNVGRAANSLPAPRTNNRRATSHPQAASEQRVRKIAAPSPERGPNRIMGPSPGRIQPRSPGRMPSEDSYADRSKPGVKPRPRSASRNSPTPPLPPPSLPRPRSGRRSGASDPASPHTSPHRVLSPSNSMPPRVPDPSSSPSGSTHSLPKHPLHVPPTVSAPRPPPERDTTAATNSPFQRPSLRAAASTATTTKSPPPAATTFTSHIATPQDILCGLADSPGRAVPHAGRRAVAAATCVTGSPLSLSITGVAADPLFSGWDPGPPSPTGGIASNTTKMDLGMKLILQPTPGAKGRAEREDWDERLFGGGGGGGARPVSGGRPHAGRRRSSYVEVHQADMLGSSHE